jgi:nucleoside-diphosphate-sugar epimerase
MRVLVTGVCGFAGSSIVRHLREARHGVEILGIDNFARPGSEVNRAALRKLGVKVVQGDARLASDFETLPPVDWVIDAAANPSVLAGLQGSVSPRQVLEHNLIGTVNVLEHCRRHGAIYASGHGVKIDYIKSYMWSSIAAAADSDIGRSNADISGSRLTDRQRAQAEQMAARCVATQYADCD